MEDNFVLFLKKTLKEDIENGIWDGYDRLAERILFNILKDEEKLETLKGKPFIMECWHNSKRSKKKG